MKSVPVNSDLEVVSTPVAPKGRPDGEEYEAAIAVLRLLGSARRFLFRATAWGMLAATLVAFLIPKEYESTTRLMPPDDQSGSGLALMATLSGKLNGGIGALGGDLLGSKSSGALFIGVLRSNTVEDQLIRKFNLKSVYWKRTWDGARQRLSYRTAIYEDRKSGIINITVTDGDPLRAAAMAQEYVAQLNAVVSELSTSSARRERLFLESRLQGVKQDLEAAERDFSEFASKNGAIDIKEQGRAMVEAAATLQGQLIAAESELEGLRQIYTDSNVRVRSVTARVAELRAQLERLGGKEDAGKDAAASQDQSLYPSLRKLPLLGVAYADLYRRTKIQEAIFETLTQEYELAKVAEAKETPSVKVLDVAEPPEQKSFPPLTVIIGWGTIISFLAGCIWVVFKNRWESMAPWDRRKRFAQDVVHTITPHMPWAPPNGSRFQRFAHSVWKRAGRNGKTSDTPSPETVSKGSS
jgi:uncharacterized protein involved in exopolysaccharide biosynthesis